VIGHHVLQDLIVSNLLHMIIMLLVIIMICIGMKTLTHMIREMLHVAQCMVINGSLVHFMLL